MITENTNYTEENNGKENYADIIIKEVDNVISEAYDIINRKKEKKLNPTQKITELENLK
jgi:lipopolysaccharide biosynthesis protein